MRGGAAVAPPFKVQEVTVSYSGDPTSSALDEVRFLLGDTNESSEHVSDEEIDYLLATHSTPIRAAYHGSLALAAKYSGKQTISVGSASLDYGAVAARYTELSKTLAARGGAAGSQQVGAPWTAVDVSASNLTMNPEWHNEGDENEGT